MPTINRKQIHPKTEYKHEDKDGKYYNSEGWKRLRQDYYAAHPLCECCMSRDVVAAAAHVHHKRIWLRLPTEAQRWAALLDEGNLMSVCSSCHSKLHAKAKAYNLDYVDELTDNEYYRI